MTKKVLACLLAMMLALSLLPGTAGAASVVASGTCGADGDNVTWSLDSDGVLTISGTGKMADYTAGWSVHGHNAETPWFGFQISSIVVEQGVTRIGDCAFAMQYGTNSILLPEGLEEIGSDCFWGGDGGYIDQITLPSTVKKIDGKLYVLKSILVDSDNPYYASQDGVLFSKDMKTLVDYPCMKGVSENYIPETYVIPNGVTTIGAGAFEDSYVIIETIPEGVTTIGDYAFGINYETGGSDVSTISFPSTLKSIGNNILIWNYIENIYYHGTEEMWNQITIGDDNDFQNTTIHYLGAPQPAGPYTITFDPNGGTVTPTTAQTNADGKLASLPTPARDGYTFDGWYTARTGGSKVSKSFVFTADTVLYARWTQNGSGGGGGGGGGGAATSYAVNIPAKAENGSVTVSPKNAAQGKTVTITPKPDEGCKVDKVTVTDKNGNPVEVKDNGDGTYSFTMPASKVNVTAAFVKNEPAPADNERFTDVPKDAWYHDAVYWAADNGITQGVDDTHFVPNGTCTRGEAVTFLWRAKGEPEPTTTTNPFKDVKESDYFYKAVLWAVENGITVGVKADSFAPKQTCSTAHILTFLYRTMGVGADGWYEDAGAWAEKDGLLKDTGLTANPKVNCPRGAVVTFLYREQK